MSRYNLVGEPPRKTKEEKLLKHRPVISDEDDEDSPVKDTRIETNVLRQHFDKLSEKCLNELINEKLMVFYSCQSMVTHFGRCDVSLPGFVEYFGGRAEEVLKHAESIMKYLNVRGGTVILQDVVKPPVDSWGHPLAAMEASLCMEMSLNENFLKLHKHAVTVGDAHLEEFMKKCINVHVKIIKTLGNHVTTLKLCGPGIGETGSP